MRRSRWLSSLEGLAGETGDLPLHLPRGGSPVCVGDEEREQFRKFMRMQENFSGCRMLSCCLMSNHFLLLLEVPPMQEGGISDELLLKHLGSIQSAAFVAGVAQELQHAPVGRK